MRVTPSADRGRDRPGDQPVPARPSRAAPAGSGRSRERAGSTLSLLAERVRPRSLAREELLPLAPALAELVGTPGLRRGTTVVVEASGARGASGASSLALALLAAPSAAGSWCAVVGLPDLGLLAAEELGVALDRLVVVPAPGERPAATVGALLEGCDVVLARLPAELPAVAARRLAARARERRAVLVLAGAGVGEADPAAGSRSWPEPPEARLSVRAARWEEPVALPVDGARAGRWGGGLLRARRVEVLVRRRRAAPEELRRVLWLPPPAGGVAGVEPAGGAGGAPAAFPAGEVLAR